MITTYPHLSIEKAYDERIHKLGDLTYYDHFLWSRRDAIFQFDCRLNGMANLRSYPLSGWKFGYLTTKLFAH